MKLSTLTKITAVLALTVACAQVQANAGSAAAKAGQILKKPPVAKKNTGNVTNLRISPDIKGEISLEQSAAILSNQSAGKKLVQFLNTPEVQANFSTSDIQVIQEAAARTLLKVYATEDCINSLQSFTSRKRYVQITRDALAVLQRHGVSFPKAVQNQQQYEEAVSAAVNSVARELGITDVEAAIATQAEVTNVCAYNGALQTTAPLKSAVVRNFGR